jgi:signal transduction histidine kinase
VWVTLLKNAVMQMLEYLRNKMLVICMSMTLLTLFSAFAAVYITTRERVNSENELKLSNAVVAAKSYSNAETDTGAVLMERPTTKTLGNLPTFSIILDELYSEIKRYSAFDISDDIYSEALNIALRGESKNKTVKIADSLWIYDVSEYNAIDRNGDIGLSVGEKNTQVTFLDITDTAKVLNDLLFTFGIVGLVMTAIIFLTSLYFANRAIKPVAAAWEKQRQFVADASHELKTPLAVMTSAYSALQANGKETTESRREWFGYLKSGMDRMEKLINNLLSLARIEGANITIEHKKFNISAAIEKSAQQFETAVNQKSVTLSRDIEQEINIVGDMPLTVQVFEILLENAVKYVDGGGRIDVEVKQEKQHVVCRVGNSGAGIAKEDLPRIFDRFYRTDRSRSEETGGYGLGLSIAKGIAETLGGEISVTSENGWTEFELVLYRLSLRDILSQSDNIRMEKRYRRLDSKWHT